MRCWPAESSLSCSFSPSVYVCVRASAGIFHSTLSEKMAEFKLFQANARAAASDSTGASLQSAKLSLDGRGEFAELARGYHTQLRDEPLH